MSDEITMTSASNGNELQELCKRAGALVSGARACIGQMSNYATVLTSFELGRYIVGEEQNGQDRAAYGAHVLDVLSTYLTEKFGRRFSRTNVANMRRFYIAFRDREPEIVQSPIAQLGSSGSSQIVQSAIAKSATNYDTRPFKLSWTHYHDREYKLYLPDKKLLQQKLNEWLGEV